jgi:hypothetical protein
VKNEDKNAPMDKNNMIPENTKKQFEDASGFSFDDVRAHYNSDKPANLSALAYTQGSQIHIGPGQDKHLAHELGHVVQQKQGRVKPTDNVNESAANNDIELERKAEGLPPQTDLPQSIRRIADE